MSPQSWPPHWRYRAAPTLRWRQARRNYAVSDRLVRVAMPVSFPIHAAPWGACWLSFGSHYRPSAPWLQTRSHTRLGEYDSGSALGSVSGGSSNSASCEGRQGITATAPTRFQMRGRRIAGTRGAPIAQAHQLHGGGGGGVVAAPMAEPVPPPTAPLIAAPAPAQIRPPPIARWQGSASLPPPFAALPPRCDGNLLARWASADNVSRCAPAFS
jgi:hypothetical protein